MPACGSQVILCDIPVRFDTYEGCGHACSYYFVKRKADISQIKLGESPEALRAWINGKRGAETRWCDWDIPLHWGGMSDPFQPAERVRKRSLEALRVFAETQYPFVFSTKSDLVIQEPYLSLIRASNCVVQFSAASPQYDKFERGAAPYEKRLQAAEILARDKRVIIRVQPYIPAILPDVIRSLGRLASIGVHGVVLEGMKYTKPSAPNLVRIGNDFVYPFEMLLRDFSAIKAACHRHGLKFYCGENRLRALGDELCCCGVEGLGWRVNTANLNHALFDPENYVFTDTMKMPGSATVFKCIEQNSLSNKVLGMQTYEEKMRQKAALPYPFISTPPLAGRFTEQQEKTLREHLCERLKASGRTRREVDRHLGTNGMAGHYFGASQWAFPTPEAFEKMREILPLGSYGETLALVGIAWNFKQYCKIYGATK